MRNEMLSIYKNKQSDEFNYPVMKNYEVEINALTMDEPIVLNKEFEELVHEAQEYGFWMRKASKVLIN